MKRTVRAIVTLTTAALLGSVVLVGVTAGPAHADTHFGTGCSSVGAALGAGTFHPMAPARLLDSRTSTGGWGASPLTSALPRTLTVAGVGGIAADATAVVGQLSVTSGTAPSSIAVYPYTGLTPKTAFGFNAGATISETVAVPVGALGKIELSTPAGSVHVIFDVHGYYSPGGAPCNDIVPVSAYSNPALGPAAPASFTVTGGAVPVTATAVVARIDVDTATNPSYLTAWAAGTTQPVVADLIFGPGTNLHASNVVVVPVGAGGQVSIVNQIGSINVHVTVLAYFDPASAGAIGIGGPFTVTPAYSPGTLSVTATATTSAPFTSYSWDWGDGTPPSSGPVANHTYGGGSPGERRVRMTALSSGVEYIGDYFVAVTTGPPDPPTAVTVVPDDHAANVSWTAPTGAVTSYIATATPGGASCTATVTSCTITGLSAGMSYSVSVKAINAYGPSGASVPSKVFTPLPGGGYHAVVPVRVLDSRLGLGWSGKLAAGTPMGLGLAGVGGPSPVPLTARAVVMNVTATNATQPSFLTVYATPGAPPTASNLNFGANQTIANLVTVKLQHTGPTAGVSFANAAGATDVIADVVGWYDDGTIAGDLFTGITPTRLLDSRNTNGGWSSPLVAGTPRDLVVRQPGRPTGVPATATAVIANVTVTGGTAGSFLSVWPAGVAPPNVSTINFAAGQTIPNLAIVQIGTADSISFANANGTVDVIVDIVGYFDPTTGSRFHPIDPTRVLDDRTNVGLSGPWGPHQSRALTVNGGGLVPQTLGGTGLVANVTATNGTKGSFATVYPNGVAKPNASNLNFAAGETIPNLVIVKLAPNGKIDLYNEVGNVDLIADVVGYYTLEPSGIVAWPTNGATVTIPKGGSTNITLHNTGNAPASCSLAVGSGGIHLSTGCAPSIPAGGSVTITVTANPGFEGAASVIGAMQGIGSYNLNVTVKNV